VCPDIKTSVSPFLFLAVDLPPPPLFQDAIEKNIIPQVSISSVLSKYDGKTTQVSGYQTSFECAVLKVFLLTGISRSVATVQVSAATTIHHSPLQALYQEYLCRREESDHRHFSSSRLRFQRLYVISRWPSTSYSLKAFLEQTLTPLNLNNQLCMISSPM
jgi:hypothetical protein